MQDSHETISRSLIRGILFAAIFCLLFSGTVEATETSEIIITSDNTIYKYIGDTIEISGTSSTGNLLNFSIVGGYFEETDLTNYIISQTTGTNWKVSISTENIVSSSGEKLYSGNYGIFIREGDAILARISTQLTYPYISIASIPNVVVQNSVLIVTVNEYVGHSIIYYIFGENLFKSGVVTYDKSTFQLTIPIDDTYAVGDYILVIQNSMIDKKFNIYPDGNNIILPVTETPQEIDVFAHHPSFAADLLCEELDGKNIDDMYVRETFTVISAPKQDPIIPEEQETPDYTYDPSNGEEDTTPITQEPNYEVPETTERNPVIEAPSDTVTEDPLPPIEGINHELGNMDTSTSTPFPYLSILAAISCIGLIIRRK